MFSSNITLEEFVLRSLSASPLTNPFLTPAKIFFTVSLPEPELIEGNGYEGRQTSKVLNNRRSYNLKVPIT